MTEAKPVQGQFQEGDIVIYVPEGIVTEVSGYLWDEAMGRTPKVIAYRLNCGIHASTGDIRMASNDERRRIGMRPRRAAA